jgi:hypothetical protein
MEYKIALARISGRADWCGSVSSRFMSTIFTPSRSLPRDGADLVDSKLLLRRPPMSAITAAWQSDTNATRLGHG